jgi:hypothetical protein
MVLKHLKRGFVALLVLVSFTVFITACGRPEIPACVPDFNEVECPVLNCPFGQCFEGDYVKQTFVSGKVHITGISNDACGELFEDKYNATNYLCKLLQAEQIYKVGNGPDGEEWEWSVDCECSYQK